LDFANKAFSLLQRDIFLFTTNLITGILVARKLGPGIFGVWVILQMIPAYAEAFVEQKWISRRYIFGQGENTDSAI